MIDVTARSFVLLCIGGIYGAYGFFLTPIGVSQLHTGIIIVAISVVLQEIEHLKQKVREDDRP